MQGNNNCTPTSKCAESSNMASARATWHENDINDNRSVRCEYFKKEKDGWSEDIRGIYNKETCNKRLKCSTGSATSSFTHLRSCDHNRTNQAKNGIENEWGNKIKADKSK